MRLSCLILILIALMLGSCDRATFTRTNKAMLTNNNWYQPQVGITWQWQLTGKINRDYAVQLYDLDLFDTPTVLISKLQAKNKRVICYFSAGSYEEWRSDADRFVNRDLGNTLAGWEDERWLDIRSAQVREIMKDRMNLAVKKGCNGVEPDNIDGYLNQPGFNLTAKDQLAFNLFLAQEAHQRNLAVGLKNDLEQIPELVTAFDFAVNEQCFEYHECDRLIPFISLGKPVLNAEYSAKYIKDRLARKQMCDRARKMQFSSLILPVDLNDKFRFSCFSHQ